MKSFFFWTLFTCTICTCNQKEKPAGRSEARHDEVLDRIPSDFPYTIAEPDTVFTLAEDLNEISGLQWWGEDNLLSIADEKGVVYVLNAANGRMRYSYMFEEKGDFEGICLSNNDVYVLKSNGDIFQISDLSSSNSGKVNKIETGLDYDCEGLFFNASSGKFLIACKDTVQNGERAIFTTGLKAGEKARKTFTIAVESVRDSLITNSFDKVAYAVANVLSARDHAGILGPSGVAVSPIDQKIYLLSGTSALLIILSAEGRFENAIPLPIDILPQPEGITFSPSGDLFIASERANKQHGVIAKFGYNE